MLKPDLVLLDLGLLDTRGAGLVQAIREVSTDTRFIGMTSADSQASRARAMGCGVDYFVPLGPSGHTELTVMVHALQPGGAHH